ncbi:hypothetical protein CL632_00420 [bacterium]|jgi:uncharacterized membrane protein|nr:hypothetical protein [bacterium]MDP6756319.1 DUF2061 domain-containing protein [Patescibacteria group bacterium]|tara:strand:- start:10509 stop:10751 length:243 start_codon:yes stop_codon:yes gene_type:complete
MFHENHSRTLLKSITWLIIGFLIAFGVIYYFTRDIRMALIDSAAIQLIKFIFFYLHERVWNIHPFGQELRIKKIIKKLST